MGSAFVCDRCDDLQEGTPASTIKTEAKKSHRTKKDLCDDCTISYNEWFRTDGA